MLYARGKNALLVLISHPTKRFKQFLCFIMDVLVSDVESSSLEFGDMLRKLRKIAFDLRSILLLRCE